MDSDSKNNLWNSVTVSCSHSDSIKRLYNSMFMHFCFSATVIIKISFIVDSTCSYYYSINIKITIITYCLLLFHYYSQNSKNSHKKVVENSAHCSVHLQRSIKEDLCEIWEKINETMGSTRRYSAAFYKNLLRICCWCRFLDRPFAVHWFSILSSFFHIYK